MGRRGTSNGNQRVITDASGARVLSHVRHQRLKGACRIATGAEAAATPAATSAALAATSAEVAVAAAVASGSPARLMRNARVMNLAPGPVEGSRCRWSTKQSR